MREPTGENALDQAVKRLDAAMAQLAARLARTSDSGLSAALDQARAREKDLEAAGAEASVALGRAIAEIKAALQSEPEPQNEEA